MVDPAIKVASLKIASTNASNLTDEQCGLDMWWIMLLDVAIIDILAWKTEVVLKIFALAVLATTASRKIRYELAYGKS